MIFLHVLFFYYVFFVSYLLNIYDYLKPKVKNYKSLLIAGAIAVGLYLFLHRKKIIPMTHPSRWRDMTLAQRLAYIRRTTLTTTADKIKALKEARRQKSTHENTPLMETKLTPEEQEAVLQALEAEKEQGTGFDYIRERAPYNEAVPVEDEKKAEVRKATAHKIAHKIGKEIAEKVMKKIEDKKKADKKQKTADLGYSKKKSAEDVLRDLLLATPRSEVKHTQEYGEESEEEPKKQKSIDWVLSNKKTTGDALQDYVNQQKEQKIKDQGYSKKKTTEEILEDLGFRVVY